MAYFLRKEKRKNGVYLQMYDRNWIKELGQPRNKYIQSFGFVEELKAKGMKDPIAFYENYVKEKEQERQAQFNEETRPRAFKECMEKNAGSFLVKTVIDELGVKDVIDILASTRKFQFSIYELIVQLISSRIIEPCSKYKTINNVFPRLYNYSPMTEDQVLDGLNFIGEFYPRYIELFNHQYEQYYKRNYSKTYFDCTNYYFEIDVAKEDKQKGPSKEQRNEPIIGQALLLDADMLPLSMEMYPGNQSEKPFIRTMIEKMKKRYNVSGRTIQIADKGLNCARNIYAAVKESNDGYIFSKSVHGKNLSEQEKQWVLMENDANVFTNYCDSNGELKYRLKSCVDTFEYKFKEIDPETGKEEITKFSVKEKRIVSFNPSLAEKQKMEIRKMAEKASRFITMKSLTRDELGEAAKYVKVSTTDKNGNKVKPSISLNEELLEEDLKYAGYNLIVTSETKMPPQQVYSAYHNLWRIEECFRITKSYLDGRPVYVQKKETIYGHFLICYLALFIIRILEMKCFKNQVNAYDIIDFIRDFRVVDRGDGVFINISNNKLANEKIKSVTGLTLLDALFLSENELFKLFNSTILLDSEY